MADRQKSLPTNKRLFSILPLFNRFICDKTRPNQRLDAKHYSVTAYEGFSLDHIVASVEMKSTQNSLTPKRVFEHAPSRIFWSRAIARDTDITARMHSGFAVKH